MLFLKQPTFVRQPLNTKPVHELSIALGIVKVAEEQCRRAGGRRIEKVEVVIGKLSGVELPALRFAWPMATQGTAAEGAALEIEEVPAMARCGECEKEFSIERIFDPCPHCGSYFRHITQGKELRVKALEIT